MGLYPPGQQNLRRLIGHGSGKAGSAGTLIHHDQAGQRLYLLYPASSLPQHWRQPAFSISSQPIIFSFAVNILLYPLNKITLKRMFVFQLFIPSTVVGKMRNASSMFGAFITSDMYIKAMEMVASLHLVHLQRLESICQWGREHIIKNLPSSAEPVFPFEVPLRRYLGGMESLLRGNNSVVDSNGCRRMTRHFYFRNDADVFLMKHAVQYLLFLPGCNILIMNIVVCRCRVGPMMVPFR